MKEQIDQNSIFSGFVSEKPSFTEIQPVTNHPFKLIAWGTGNSFKTPSGETKDNLPPWSDPTPEVWLHLASTKGAGTIFYHANGCAYREYDKLTADEIATGAYEPMSSRMSEDDKGNVVHVDGAKIYAVTTDPKTKLKVREVDLNKREACKRIFNGILAAFGKEPGQTLDVLDEIRDANTEVIADVVAGSFAGSPQMRIANFRDPAKIKVKSEEWDEGA